MWLNSKWIIPVLAGTVLVSAAPAFASSPAPIPAILEEASYMTERASTLLSEIQAEARGLKLHAETLGTLAWDPKFSWQSHAFYLERVKTHINEVGTRIGELQRIQHAVAPWQQQAISEITSDAATVAARTEAAIAHLRDNQQRLFISEYRDHVMTIADRSTEMKEKVDKFLEYEKAKQRHNELQTELEIAGE